MKEVIQNFSNLNILVVGDVMVDAYYWGNVNRTSPEAPVPVVDITNREFRLGGAANVVRNLLSLDINTQLCSVIGKDNYGDTFRSLLSSKNLSIDGIVGSSFRPTTIKTRIISADHHLLRVDEEIIDDLNSEECESLLTQIEKSIESFKPHTIVY